MNTIGLVDLEGIPEIKSGFLILQETEDTWGAKTSLTSESPGAEFVLLSL